MMHYGYNGEMMACPFSLIANKGRRGFNLIEAAIVLGVVGLVVGGIWVAAAAVTTSRNVTETAQGLLRVCTKSTQLFDSRSAPSGPDTVITSSALAAGVFPETWVNGGSVTSPIGGSVELLWLAYDWGFGGVSALVRTQSQGRQGFISMVFQMRIVGVLCPY